jgi:hypothetical protein
LIGNKSYNSAGAAGPEKWVYEEILMYGPFTDLQAWDNSWGVGTSGQRATMQTNTRTDEWNTWAATVTATGITGLGANVLSARFNRSGRLVNFGATIQITATGPGAATPLNLSLPSIPKSGAAGTGMDISHSAVCGVAIGTDRLARVTRYDGAYPVSAAPIFLRVAGSYEVD